MRFGENLTATVLRALEIANFVDSVSPLFVQIPQSTHSTMHAPHNTQLYQDLNIRVVLVDVTTWTNGDQINVVSNPDTLLDNFGRYRQQITAEHDSAMLIT